MNNRLKGTYQNKIKNFVSNHPIASFKGNMFSRVNTELANKNKGIQCKECEGYGHIQAKCANTRKKNKSYTVTWSDEESEK